MIPPTAANPLALEPGEKELWTGVPRQGIVLRSVDVLLIPFTVLWAAFAISWETSALRSPAPGIYALWGIPFVVAGGYFSVGRFFADRWRRGRTSYSLTSQRVTIRSGPTLKSLSLRTLSDVTLTERADGSWTITFGPTGFQTSPYNGALYGRPQQPMLEMIPDARRVNEKIREAQQAAFAPVATPLSPLAESPPALEMT